MLKNKRMWVIILLEMAIMFVIQILGRTVISINDANILFILFTIFVFVFVFVFNGLEK